MTTTTPPTTTTTFTLGSAECVTGRLSLQLFKNVTNSNELLAIAKRGEIDAALLATDRVRGGKKKVKYESFN